MLLPDPHFMEKPKYLVRQTCGWFSSLQRTSSVFLDKLLIPLHPRQSRCVRKIRQSALDVNGYSCWSIESGQYIVILSVTKNNLQWWFWMIIMWLWIIRFSTHNNPVKEALFTHCDLWEQWYLEKLIEFPRWSLSCPLRVWFLTLLAILGPHQTCLKNSAIPFSRGSSWLRDQAHISCIAGEFFATEPPGKPNKYGTLFWKKNSAKEFKDKGETWRTLSQRWIRLFF